LAKVRILHTADNHLDPKLGIYGNKAYERKADFLRSFEFIVKYALENRPDIILISGDLFDSVNPRNPARTQVIRALKSLANNGIKIFAIVGNHDAPKSREEGASPLHEIEATGYITFFAGPNRPGVEHVKIRDIDVCVSGISYDHTLDYDKDPIEYYNIRLPTEGDVNIAMLHYNFESFIIPDLWKAPKVRVKDIPKDLDYLALGHLHKYQIVEINKTLVVNPGSTERRSFAEEGDEKKGFVWVEISDDGSRKVDFIEVPSRPMKTISVALDSSVRDPVGKVVEHAVSLENRNLILRIRINGKLPLDKLTLYRRSDVLARLQERFFYVIVDDRELEYLHESVEPLGEIWLGPKEAFRKHIEADLKKATDDKSKEVLRRALKYGLEALDEVGAW